MERIAFRGEPAIVDLTTERRLADRVEEAVVECLGGFSAAAAGREQTRWPPIGPGAAFSCRPLATPTCRRSAPRSTHLTSTPPHPARPPPEDERDAALYYLLARHPGRALVFVNAVSAVRRVAAVLKLLGLPATALHAQQQQRQRLKALDRFKANENGVLVATDVAARGACAGRGRAAARASFGLADVARPRSRRTDLAPAQAYPHSATPSPRHAPPPRPRRARRRDGGALPGARQRRHIHPPLRPHRAHGRRGRHRGRAGGCLPRGASRLGRLPCSRPACCWVGRQLQDQTLCARARPLQTPPPRLPRPQVSPGEAARWGALLRAMGRADTGAAPPAFPVDRTVLKMAAQRVALAEKVGGRGRRLCMEGHRAL
jgi:hypothetical protein